MPNQKIFCISPWYEFHMYQDGGMGICCQADHRFYAPEDRQKYNIANMTIAEWFNSEPVKQFRQTLMGDQKSTICKGCYFAEEHSGNSRREKANLKSAIFTRQAFDESFKQSPSNKHFMFSAENNGETLTMPIDLHIDLGNYCNLACKMCRAENSSTIAVQEVKWGIKQSQQYVGTDWTRDSTVWERFKQEVVSIPNLKNIHFSGGETLITEKFEDFVDTMIQHQKFDVCFSFVSNGTVFRSDLLDKLKRFERVGIEISIETVDEHNTYQRQGTDTKLVLDNIKKYQEWCNGTTITITLRPTPTVLTVGYLCTLLEYALENRYNVKYSPCYKPDYMRVEILPTHIKELYKSQYQSLVDRLNDVIVPMDYNASDPNNYQQNVKETAIMCIDMLSTPDSPKNELLLDQLIRHCERWDKVYNHDARVLYPEWADLLTHHGYKHTAS